MLSRFIYVVACIGTLFLFWLKVCCMGILCFILSSIDGYLGFHFLAIMNNAAINLLCTNFCFEIYFKDLFCFWLHWVFVAVCGLCLVAVSKGHPSLGLTGFSSRWLLFEASLGLTASCRGGFSLRLHWGSRASCRGGFSLRLHWGSRASHRGGFSLRLHWGSRA